MTSHLDMIQSLQEAAHKVCANKELEHLWMWVLMGVLEPILADRGTLIFPTWPFIGENR